MSRDLILALDPGSIKTGYALFYPTGEIKEGGVMSSSRRLPLVERLKDMVTSVEQMAPIPIAHVVIEIGTKQHGNKRNATTLGVYGMAVGVIWQACRTTFPHATVDTVEANDWTRGKPKGKRVAELAATEPGYDPAQDPGGNAADAIGVGRYWLARQKMKASIRKTMERKG